MRATVITFDCYGTLVDWEQGIWDAFVPELARVGVAATRAQIIELHWRLEPVVQAEAYRPYREVLALTAQRTFAALGAPGVSDGTFLAASVPAWRPFPDTNGALERLAGAGVRLGILSNIDDDLIAVTRRHLSAPFEPVVTAAQVRSYKPAPGHWHEARRRLGAVAETPGAWLHAAQSYFHDVVPARALGLPTAWVNRKGETPSDGGRPTHEVPDLTGLAALVLAESDR
jgi:2-haloalkanoic acid dehalogenase type II